MGNAAGRPVGADGAMTRQKIVDVARRLIAETGYTATSMRDVAAAADVTIGTLYHYFQQKTDLYRAVLADVSMFIEPRLVAAVAAAPTFVEGFQQLLEEGVKINAEDPTYTLFLASVPAQRREDPGLAKLGEPTRERRQLRALVETGMATGELDPRADPESVVRLLASMISGVSYMTSEGWDTSTSAEVLRLMGLLVAGQLVRRPSPSTDVLANQREIESSA